MITAIRIEATGDTPDQVKALCDFALARVGLGIGVVTDEVYERRADSVGYQGRLKVLFEVPMNAKDERLYDTETDRIVEMVNERLAARGSAEFSVTDGFVVYGGSASSA